jgi:hypothetical protein
MAYMRSWKSLRLTSHTWLGLNPQIGRPLSRIVVPLVFFFYGVNEADNSDYLNQIHATQKCFVREPRTNTQISDCDIKDKTVVHIRPVLWPACRSATPPTEHPSIHGTQMYRYISENSFFKQNKLFLVDNRWLVEKIS